MIKISTIKLLRIPFSFFLSPIYLFALSQTPNINWFNAALVFIIIHFLVYPASNGYNSYMDRDTGPIGGLEKPPPPSPELYRLTIVLDIIAILLSLLVDLVFTAVMISYIGASKAYSYRGIRLKRFAILSYLVVVIFQGAISFWLVYYGSSEEPSVFTPPWLGMLICALLVGGFYPLTQIYQHQQDLEDGVITISYKLGYRGTFVFSMLIYILAWICMAQFFIPSGEGNKLLLVGIFFIPTLVYFLLWWKKVHADPAAANFSNTMKMNWLAATCTNLAFLILLIWNNIE
jgi:1,4-dihydroxy-2-naphthoate octaprenyltransferase